jgi:LPXTG-motif cell wall-anchored protein
MRKLIALVLMGLLIMVGISKSFAQEDSARIAEEPKDTISIDNAEPVYYEDQATKESSGMVAYAIIGGVLVIGAAAFMVIRKKKK